VDIAEIKAVLDSIINWNPRDASSGGRYAGPIAFSPKGIFEGHVTVR